LNRGCLLEPNPIEISSAKPLVPLPKLLTLWIPQAGELDVSIPKIRIVSVSVPGGRVVGKGLGVIHRNDKPGVIDAGLVFILYEPDIGRADGGKLALAHERAELCVGVCRLHVAAARPAIH